MNKVIVRINGIEYTIKGEEKEEYMHKIAGYVDKKLKNIMEHNPRLSTTSTAVLTAVNTVDEMFKLGQAYEEIEKENLDLRENETLLKNEINNLKKQLDNMEQFNTELKEKLKNSNTEEEVEKLKTNVQKQLQEISNLKLENKELKFQNQSYKFKVIDLQNKLIDSQIDLAKSKKINSKKNNVLLSNQ